METNELRQKITEVFISFEDMPEANMSLFVDDIIDIFEKEYKKYKENNEILTICKTEVN